MCTFYLLHGCNWRWASAKFFVYAPSAAPANAAAASAAALTSLDYDPGLTTQPASVSGQTCSVEDLATFVLVDFWTQYEFIKALQSTKQVGIASWILSRGWLLLMSIAASRFVYPYTYLEKYAAIQKTVRHWAIVPGVSGIDAIVALQPNMALRDL